MTLLPRYIRHVRRALKRMARPAFAAVFAFTLGKSLPVFIMMVLGYFVWRIAKMKPPVNYEIP